MLRKAYRPGLHGQVIIPFVYSPIACCYDATIYFTVSGLALVHDPEDGWQYINTRNGKFGRAMTLDNIPDEAFGGLARFRAANGKIGYLGQDLRVVIPAQYDSAFPFADCTALVCVGCSPDRWSQREIEAPGYTPDYTGEEFIIDVSGKRLKPKPLIDDQTRGAALRRTLGSTSPQSLSSSPFESQRPGSTTRSEATTPSKRSGSIGISRRTGSE